MAHPTLGYQQRLNIAAAIANGRSDTEIRNSLARDVVAAASLLDLSPNPGGDAMDVTMLANETQFLAHGIAKQIRLRGARNPLGDRYAEVVISPKWIRWIFAVYEPTGRGPEELAWDYIRVGDRTIVRHPQKIYTTIGSTIGFAEYEAKSLYG